MQISIRNWKKTLGLCIVFYLITSYFSVGFHQLDEHFQIMEFSGLKYGINQPSDLAWEYHYQMRAAIQPAIAYLVHCFFSIAGSENPFYQATFLRMLSACLSLLSTLFFIKVMLPKITDDKLKKWFIYLSLFLWFAVYNYVRFSSENWSIQFFIIGLALLLKSSEENLLYSKPHKLHKLNIRIIYVLIGLLMGLAFLFRYQIGFMILGLIAWLVFIKNEKFNSILLIISGIVVSIFIGVIVDRWFYNQWTFTAYNYFEQNILLNKVASFGNNPWWYIFEQTFNKAIPPFSLIFIFSFLIVFIFDSKNIISWICLPFILAHTIIGHKEIRFFFPIINFVPIFIIQALLIIKSKKINNVFKIVTSKWLVYPFWFVNVLVLLFVCFKPADTNIALYQKIYNNYKNPTVLYYIDDNPYDRSLYIHFYKNKNLIIKKINTLTEIKKSPEFTDILFVSNNSNIDAAINKSNIQYIRIYNRIPDWVKNFDFNGWLGRTKAWTLYEIKI